MEDNESSLLISQMNQDLIQAQKNVIGNRIWDSRILRRESFVSQGRHAREHSISFCLFVCFEVFGLFFVVLFWFRLVFVLVLVPMLHTGAFTLDA